MATRTKPQFEALYGTSGTTFNDNTTGDISAGDMRALGQDIADSVFTAGIISSKVTIPTASILTAFTTPVTLIAAQGAGTMIEVLSFSFFLDYNSAAYATNTTLLFGNQNGTPYALAGLISQANDVYHNYPANPVSIGTSNLSNYPITLSVQTGNPTAGNSPLYVYLTYRVITL